MVLLLEFLTQRWTLKQVLLENKELFSALLMILAFTGVFLRSPIGYVLKQVRSKIKYKKKVGALCPNCHRAMHHATNKEELNEGLYGKVKRLVRT